MKNQLSLLVLILLATSVFSQVYKGREANDKISGSEIIRYNEYSEVPSYIKFKKNDRISKNYVFDWLKRFYKDENNISYSIISENKDKYGYNHLRYKQAYKGIPIELSTYIIHVRNNKVVSMNGNILNEFNAPTVFNISEEAALNKAKKYIGAEIYKWELTQEEDFIKVEQNDPNASFYPKAEKVLFPKSGKLKSKKLRPAYKFNIYAHKPISRSYVYVDAINGDILFENKIIHNADATGTAETAKSGTQTIVADSYGGNYRLRESGRGNGIETYDMNMGTDYSNAVDFIDDDNYWNNINGQLDEYATDAHWAAEMTYDYYFNEHGRNSIDNNGLALLSYIHFDLVALGYPNNVNAFWDGQRMSYGDGNDSNITPLTVVDICAHEITHGLTSYTADLNYQDESGALNEGFSDIFGSTVEFHAKPATANWDIGEDIGVTIRSLANPNAYGLPDTYLGTNWYTGTDDNGGVHTNCGVLMYWYYLICDGGSGTNDNGDSYNITGIGINNADDIAFRMLTVYLTNTSQYDDARFYAIQSAIDLYGACTQEVETVTNAMYAVGVGAAYNPSVVSDFEADITQACAAPAQINFSNLSNNASNFTWYFGDGNTSTDNNPTHTYTNLGDYDVKLVSDGGSCGIDSIIKTAYIEIDTNLPCVAYMPTSGTSSHFACSGKLYDSGGPSANYHDQTDVSFTIEPPGADQITLTINSFDIETGNNGCNYDYVAFYDGPTSSDPLINNTTYCNTNGSPGTITSTGGAITVRLYSDQAVNEAGFDIDWTCAYPTSPPNANFDANITVSCNGTINFNDLSTNGPLGWEWDFGDGNTSTDQNPVHSYSSDGTYSVTLIASNANGNDTITLQDYITINLPDEPVVTTDTVCENNAATLQATANGTVYWYDDATAGTLLDTGQTFTTPVLTNTTDYFVENIEDQPSQYVGETNNTASGGFLAYEHYLVFDCYSNVKLKSVEVNAETTGNRTIELRDNGNNLLQDTTMSITAGVSRIDLNFDLPVENDLRLVCAGTPDLFRNNSGTSYPYEISGLVSIKHSSAGSDPTGYYYYFYDWELQEAPCVSNRIPVTAFVETCTGIDVKNINKELSIYPNPANNQLFIESDITIQSASITDINGKTIISEYETLNTKLKFNLSSLKSGIYICRIISENKTFNERIIIL